MAVLKITDLVDKGQIEDIKALDTQLGTLVGTYKTAATELAKGIKIKIDAPRDLDKLYTLHIANVKRVNETTTQLNSVLEKEKAILMGVATQMEKQLANGNLSTKQMKELSEATAKNAAALDKVAKAEAASEKAQQAANKTRKSAVLSEEDRLRVIKEAIELSKKEVHSINEANEVNKKLREAVKMVKDTDEDYMHTLGQLNGAIGVNTDLVRRNSDRYTQQKMNIGNYKDSIKQAYIELKNGNNTMKNMGIIARNSAKILNSELSIGFERVGVSVGGMIKGIVGAQLLMKSTQFLVQKFKEGITTAIEFQHANSNLAAILGVTKKQTQDLQIQARLLGASTKYTAAEATNLQVELAKLGFTMEEIKNSTSHVLRFAQATGAELSESAALAGAALRMFNADTTETERYVSAMAVSTARSALSFEKLSTAMPIVGPVAKAFNFTIEDTLALLGKLSDAGFDASMAATATRNIILNLADSNGKLAKSLGGPVNSLPELVDGLIKLRDKGVDLNATLEMTDKRSVAAFNAFLTAADGIMPLREAITDVSDDLNKMAHEMTDDTAGAVKTLQSVWEELMITINGSTGAIRTTIEFITDAVRDITNMVKSTKQLADEIAYGSVASATEEDFKRDTDAIERTTDAYIKAGKTRTEAEKLAREERVKLLEMSLSYEREALKKHEDRYNRMKLQSMDENSSKYLRQVAENTMKILAPEINTYTSSIAILEARLKKLQNVSSTNKGGGGGSDTNNAEKERLRILDELQQSELDLLEDGQEKEIQALVNAYNKKMATIKGSSKEENQLRLNLAELLQKDIQAIENKYADERQKKLEEQASENIATIAENAAAEQAALTQEYEMAMLALDKELAILGGGATEEQKRTIEDKKFQLTKDYALKSAEAVIDSLELQLNQENITAEDRLRLTEELQKAKDKLAQEEAQQEIEAIKRVEEEDRKSAEKRIENVRQWLNFTSEAVGAIGDLVGNIYEGKIQKIEAEQKANEKAGEKELERIERMQENGAISTEEAEARKRAAEERTAQQNEELERKKIALQRKQAMWDKATQLAQAGIATALAVTEALPNMVLAALVGAMGAMQMATIASTPIPAYAEGTKNGSHPGGAALVGDGGKHELVTFNGKAWLTPDTPTLVDLPRGAKVFPDVEDGVPDWGFASLASSILPVSNDSDAPIIINDYSRLERKMGDNNELMLLMLKYLKGHSNNLDFELYKHRKL